jgi:hypothetical protein
MRVWSFDIRIAKRGLSPRRFRMKRRTTCLSLGALSVALIMIPGFAQDGPVQSQWAAPPVTVDGAMQDWEGVPLVVDKGSKAEYAFKNDGENLYVLFVFKDSVAKSTVDQLGMTVYYNLVGKKKKAEGLHFLRKNLTPDELITSLEAKGEVVTDERKAEFRKMPGFIIYEGELIGRKPSGSADSVPIEPPTFRAQLIPPPKAKAQPEAKQEAPPMGRRGGAPSQGSQRGGGTTVYEFRIPLAKNPVLGGIGTEPGKSLKLYFEWGGMTKEMMARAMTQTAEGSTSARSGSMSTEQALSGGSDNLDTARDRSGGLRRNANAKKHSFWVDVALAAKIE